MQPQLPILTRTNGAHAPGAASAFDGVDGLGTLNVSKANDCYGRRGTSAASASAIFALGLLVVSTLPSARAGEITNTNTNPLGFWGTNNAPSTNFNTTGGANDYNAWGTAASGATNEAFFTNNATTISVISGNIYLNYLAYTPGTGSSTLTIGSSIGQGTLNFVGTSETINQQNNGNIIINSSIVITNLLTQTGNSLDYVALNGVNYFTNGTYWTTNAGGGSAGSTVVNGTNYGGSYSMGGQSGSVGFTIGATGLITNALSITDYRSMSILNGGAVNVSNYTYNNGASAGFPVTGQTLTINDTNQASVALNGLTNFSITGENLTVNSSFLNSNAAAIQAVNPYNLILNSGYALTFNNASTNATNNTFVNGTVTLNGGTFNYSANNSSGNNLATLGALSLQSNIASYLNTTNGATGSTNTLQIGSLTLGSNATLQVNLGTQSASNGLVQIVNTNLSAPVSVGGSGVIAGMFDTAGNPHLLHQYGNRYQLPGRCDCYLDPHLQRHLLQCLRGREWHQCHHREWFRGGCPPAQPNNGYQ
jgi:hypothetical protein